MGEASSAEQCHERSGKGCKTQIKGFEGGFSREGISQQHRHKIDDLVVAKMRAGKAHVFLDGFEKTELGEHLSQHCHFTKPGRDGSNGFGDNLDFYASMCHTLFLFSLVGNEVFPPSKETPFWLFYNGVTLS